MKTLAPLAVLDKNNESPLYEQVREHLREYCLSQGANVPLAPVRELCELLGVNQTTVTRAMRDLEADGLLRIVPRKGSFVVAAPEALVELIALAGPSESLGDTSQRFLRGMQDAYKGNDTISGTALNVPPYPDAKRFAEMLRLRQVAALAITGHDYRSFPDSLDETNFIYALSRQVPVVLIGKPHRWLELDSVYTDARPQMLEWLNQCYDNGIRDFAFVSTVSDAVHYRERYEAFRQFHLDHAVKWNPELIPTVNEVMAEQPAGRGHLFKLLYLERGPRAIVVQHPAAAYTLVMEAHRRGLKPGTDVHILLFAGNDSHVQGIEPYVTVIMLREEEMGRCAMVRIEERLKGKGKPEPYIWRLPATTLPPSAANAGAAAKIS